MNYKTKHTIKEILSWLFIFIVGSLIVSFIIQPDSFQSFKSNVDNFLSGIKNNVEVEKDPLIKQCEIYFNECKERAEAKDNSLVMSLIKIEKFNDVQNATKFREDWNSFPISIVSITKDFPYALLAIRVNNAIDGGSSSWVIKCYMDKMEKFSVLGLNIC